jgi:hypothetical protein
MSNGSKKQYSKNSNSLSEAVNATTSFPYYFRRFRHIKGEQFLLFATQSEMSPDKSALLPSNLEDYLTRTNKGFALILKPRHIFGFQLSTESISSS